jgi:hypothetical protein
MRSDFRSKRFGRTHGRRHLHRRAQIRSRLVALREQLQQAQRRAEAPRLIPAAPPIQPARPPEPPTPTDLQPRDPDEVLFPAPFRDPADFAPIPPPQARLADLLELAGHTGFVLLVTVLLPLVVLWAGYRLYRWLPFETMALMVVSAAALWAYRDRLLPLIKRILFGRAD